MSKRLITIPLSYVDPYRGVVVSTCTVCSSLVICAHKPPSHHTCTTCEGECMPAVEYDTTGKPGLPERFALAATVLSATYKVP